MFAIFLPTSKQFLKFRVVLSFPFKKETMHAVLFFSLIKKLLFLFFKGFGQLIPDLLKVSINLIKNGISFVETLFSKIVKIYFLLFVFNK